MIQVATPVTGKEEFNAVKKIILSGKFVSGNIVDKFEKDFAKFIGTKYAIALNSGTAALHTALRSLNIKKGDEVIVPAISFVSTATAVLHQGATPVFCDVDINSFCIDPKSFSAQITKKTKAVIPVHFAGGACDIKEILRIAKKNKILVIEDCAQAHGTKIEDKLVGSFGDISCFSFYATKHMTTGEGGMICTNKKKIYEFCKSFRNHGMINRDTHKFLGYNFRMNEMSAAIGRVQLKKINNLNNKRVKNSLYLIKKLKSYNTWFKVQDTIENIYHTYFWCPVRIISKKISIEEVRKRFLKRGIEIRSRYKFPLYKQEVFQKLIFKKSQNYKKLHLKNSEILSGKIFGLPNHFKLKKKDLDYIVKTTGNLFEK